MTTTNRIKEKFLAFARGWIGSIIIALLVALTFKSAIAEFNFVPTGSMKPTILEGDYLWVNKLAYDLKVPFTTTHLAQWADPQRGDIVIFYSPRGGTRLVKRVAGLPGETIAMRDNRLIIDGKPLEYKPAPSQLDGFVNRHFLFFVEEMPEHGHMVMVSPQRFALSSFGPVTVPEGHFFMLGDNRDNSADSRFIGFVPRSNILGRVRHAAISFQLDKYLLPRPDRFFTRLR